MTVYAIHRRSSVYNKLQLPVAQQNKYCRNKSHCPSTGDRQEGFMSEIQIGVECAWWWVAFVLRDYNDGRNGRTRSLMNIFSVSYMMPYYLGSYVHHSAEKRNNKPCTLVLTSLVAILWS